MAITHYGFVIDNRRCIGCHACTVACEAEHDDPGISLPLVGRRASPLG